MAQYPVTLLADEGVFRGLSKQNLLFHQCIAELVDNAISASPDQFHIDIVFDAIADDRDHVNVFVTDMGTGMDRDHLSSALQLGKSATIHSRLNEHGFGLKNALATLSGGNGPWTIWTKKGDTILSVEGPFKTEMTIKDDIEMPERPFLRADVSTLVMVKVSIPYLRTLQPRGRPTADLELFRNYLIEHLGVLYRGFLNIDEATGFPSGTISVGIGTNSIRVPSVEIPMGQLRVERFTVELGGESRELTYNFGTLDAVQRERLIRGNAAKTYYQGNTKTQGIDIRLGKRVIATHQFETIWKTTDGENALARHNRYNEFAGELVIPELPRGVLGTVNNKTDFDLQDPDWEKIFTRLNEIRPIEDVREVSEAEIRNKWVRMLKATNPDDTVTDEKTVWPTGTRIDVYRETPGGKKVIYELKVTNAAPINLYQLKMYWDGLAINGEFVDEAILLVNDFSTAIEEMANKMNEKLTPPKGSRAYNFRVERLRDRQLT